MARCKESKQKLKFEILQFSEDKIDSSNSQVKNELKEPKRELTYEILKFSEDESESSDMCNDTEEDTCDTQEEISFHGHRKYINPNVFADLEPEKRSAVPMDIDGVCIFTVAMLKNGSLDDCKGGRPWGRAISSNFNIPRISSLFSKRTSWIISIILLLFSPFFRKSLKFLGIFDKADCTLTRLDVSCFNLSGFFNDCSQYASATMSILSDMDTN